MESLKEQYIKLLADKILVSVEDLTDNERTLIIESFDLFENKMEDISILNDELKRVNIELLNLKSMRDDTEFNYDED